MTTITFPMIYTVVATIGAKRIPDHYYVGEWTSVEIPEASGFDAPPVITQNGLPILRLYEGRLYQPMNDAAGEPRTTASLENLLVTGHSANEILAWHPETHQGITYPNPNARFFAAGNGTASVRPFDQWQFKVIARNERDDRIAEIEKFAASTLIIDGIVHRLAPEPVYEVTRDGSLDLRTARMSIDMLKRQAILPFRHFFRVDRFNDAIDHLESLGHRLTPDTLAIIDAQRVEVLMPEILGDGDEVASFLAITRLVLLSFSTTEFVNLSLDDIASWVTLRDAYLNAIPEDSPLLSDNWKANTAGARVNAEVDLDDLSDLVEAFADTPMVCDLVRSEIHLAVARFRMRPMTDNAFALNAPQPRP